MVTQFIAAFDDIVIGRYNKNRDELDKINVRYVYAPKERVMYDIINENKTITLPAVAVSIKSVARDTSRVFNKLDGFYYSGTSGEERTSRHVKPPVPVNINLGVSILTRYQTDMDQILSNFIPFSNPYVVISWKVPKDFNLSTDQEIRSEVLWDGNVGLNYPTELNASAKARITADTSFTIKGWMFKDVDDPVGNIFYIDQNFNAVDIISGYESMENENSPTESFELSGSPHITDIFYNSVKLFNDTEHGSFNILTNKESGLFTSAGTGTANIELISESSNYDTSATHVRVSGSLPAVYRGIFPVNSITADDVAYSADGQSSGGPVGCFVEVGTLSTAPSGINIILNGTGFANTETVLFSSNNSSLYTSLTSLSATTRQPAISGQSIPFTIVNDNTITFLMPDISGGIGDVIFIPYNKAGYSFSDSTLETETFSGNSTFIKIIS